MTSAQLPNHLLGNRKRLSLYQDEVGFLIGTESGEAVCRQEKFHREPSLLTAFAYEVIYNRPIKVLFAGLYARIEKGIATRAKLLLKRAGNKKQSRQNERKIQALMEIIGRLSANVANPS